MINLSKAFKVNQVNTSVVNNFGSSNPAKVLVVDDHPFSRVTAVDLLALDSYEVLELDGSSDILEDVLHENPDLILLDIFMPQNNGFDLCESLKADSRTALIPIILMTVADDQSSRIRSSEVGADGLLIKPLERLELLPKVELLIQKKRLEEWLDQIEQVLFLIAQVVEERYLDGSSSFAKLDQLAQSFGQHLQLSSTAIKDLILAARLHDIGTVVIPDAILLKKGELTTKERELIKRHVLIGERIAQPLAHRRDVSQIIRHHHERWDGSGYPDGLTGHEIPWLAQVFQILDIYDALTSERPYKEALSPVQAVNILTEEVAKGWRNPDLVREFTIFIQMLELEKR